MRPRVAKFQEAPIQEYTFAYPRTRRVSKHLADSRIVTRKSLIACFPEETEQDSAELKGPPKPLRIRPEIFEVEPDLGLKLGQTKPEIPGTVPTNRHTTIPNDSGQISACFDDDLKL